MGVESTYAVCDAAAVIARKAAGNMCAGNRHICGAARDAAVVASGKAAVMAAGQYGSHGVAIDDAASAVAHEDAAIAVAWAVHLAADRQVFQRAVFAHAAEQAVIKVGCGYGTCADSKAGNAMPVAVKAALKGILLRLRNQLADGRPLISVKVNVVR